MTPDSTTSSAGDPTLRPLAAHPDWFLTDGHTMHRALMIVKRDEFADEPESRSDALDTIGHIAELDQTHQQAYEFRRSAKWLRMEAYRNDRICHRRFYRRPGS